MVPTVAGRKQHPLSRAFPRRLRERLCGARANLAGKAGWMADEAKRLAKMEQATPGEGRARTSAAACRRLGTMLGDERLPRSGAIGAGDRGVAVKVVFGGKHL